MPTHDDYKQLDCDLPLQPCPCCGGKGQLWQYSVSPTAPTAKVVMCDNGERIGPQDGAVYEGCPLYMPNQNHYRETMRDAARYWNDFAIALRVVREARTAPTRPRLPLTREAAVECLWSQLTKDNPQPLTPHWRKVLETSYEWAVDALVECTK